MGLFAKLAAIFGLARGASAQGVLSTFGEEELQRLRAAYPYPILTVPGRVAVAEWEKLKRAGQGWPVIIGDDEALGRMLEAFTIDDPSIYPSSDEVAGEWPASRSVEEILTAADTIDVTSELQRRFEEEFGPDGLEPEPGEWPEPGEVGGSGLTVHTDILTQRVFAKVHLTVLPTDDPTAVPAYLRWGGWNECPPPEVHVAVHRKWREQYGAQIVGISSDTINMRVARRPASREEALALAREQYLYCSDLIDQGTETLEVLAASLMADDWWYFWWD